VAYCPNPNCRAPLSPNVRFCAKCGTDVQTGIVRRPGGDRQQYDDLLNALKKLAANPIGNMREVFDSLEQQRTLILCGLFAVIYLICLFISSSRVIKLINELGGEMPKIHMSFDIFIRLIIIALTPLVAVAVCSLIYRSIAKTGGAFAGDLLIACLTFLPVGLCSLICSFIGISNIEVLVILNVCALCFMVVLMYAGFLKLSGLSERAAFLCVPFTWLLTLWLTSVVTRSILEGMVKSMIPSIMQ